MSRRIHFVHLPCLRMSKLVGRLVVGVVGGVFEEKSKYMPLFLTSFSLEEVKIYYIIMLNT